MNALMKTPLTMSSREIAELTGKQHKHVLADIRKMLEELNLEEKGYADISADPQNGQNYPFFNLPKNLTITLIAGYRADLRLKIVNRWMELEGPVRRTITKPRKPSLSATFQTGMRLAKTAGLEGGHAQKAAALYCEKRGLENPLDLLGVAPDRDSMGISFGEVIFWFFQGVSNDDIQYLAQNEVPTTYRAMARDECKRRGFKIGRGRK